MMENRPNLSPTDGSELTLAWDEESKDRSNKQLKQDNLTTGLGISSRTQDRNHGRNGLYEADSPIDERHRRRKDLSLVAENGGSAFGNTVKFEEPAMLDKGGRTEYTRSKRKSKKNTEIHNDMGAKSESVEVLETTDLNFWERESDGGEIEQLFDGNPYVPYSAKKQQTTGNRVPTRQGRILNKNIKGLKSIKGTKKTSDQTSIDIALVDGFHQAAATGNFQKVMMMLGEGIDVSAFNSERTTALHLAARNGQLPVVRLLLQPQHHMDIDVQDMAGKTALYWAAGDGHLTTVEYLIEMNADIDIKTVNGWTPLHAAARAGRDEVLSLLLSQGFEVDAKSHKGITPLLLAEQKEHRQCALSLLNAGANPKLKNKARDSPIQVAVSKYNKLMLKDILIKLVPDLEDETYEDTIFCLGLESDEYQNSMLWSAVENENDGMVKLFLALGVDTENLNDEGYSILHTASILGRLSTTEIILESGADTETAALDGSTALLLAAKHNHHEIVTVLLDNNANIEAKMKHTGRTALHLAVNLANVKLTGVSRKVKNEYYDNAKELVRILLKRGAYFGATDKIGKTPLDLAKNANQLRAATDVLLNPPAGKPSFTILRSFRSVPV